MVAKLRNPLTVSLYGMDNRMQKLVSNYLEFTCQGVAKVVPEHEAEVEIVDFDSSHSQQYVERQLKNPEARPIIVISIDEVNLPNTIFIKKPFEKNKVIASLKIADNIIKVGFFSEKNKTDEQQNSSLSSEPQNQEQMLDFPKKLPDHFIDKFPEDAPLPSESDKQNNIIPMFAESEEFIQESAKLSNRATDDFQPEVKNAFLSENTETIATDDPHVIDKDSETNTELKEIAKIFEGKHQPIKLKITPEEFFSTPETNRRKTVRYSINPLNCELYKTGFIKSRKPIAVQIIDISSRGALLKCPGQLLKLNSKVKIVLNLENRNFKISAIIVRHIDDCFAINFSRYQHELCDFLDKEQFEFNVKS